MTAATFSSDAAAAVASERLDANDALGAALAGVADTLRRSTVEIHAGGAGVGSGVVWHADGLVVTNAHVARSERVTVVTSDRRALPGRLAARDPRCDLAAIVVDADATLEAAALRTTNTAAAPALRPGDLVLAFGSPLGIAGAIALGVVHVVDWAHPGRPRWIVADIRLAPGNSGGPLADARGRVLGINTMIAGGLGVAVPVAAVERFLAESGVRASAVGSRAA